MKAPETKIAVTLFNLREYCKTAEELDDTLAKVRKIGYQAVQVSGIGQIEPAIVKSLLDKYELYVCATHEGLDNVVENFDDVVNKLKLWECYFTAIGSPGASFDWKAESVAPFCKKLEDVGRKFKNEGIQFGFHNHHREFVKYNGKIFLEEVYKRTDPEALYAEIDVHWVQRGGQNPVKWIYKVDGRMPVVHFKDFAIVDGEPRFCEIGEGNLDWPEIIKACEETGVRWYSIEQDRTIHDRDIFESIKISYDNLIAMGVK